MSYKDNDVTGNITFNVFSGGGEMSACMQAFDWDNHPLGNPAQWPESLKMNIRLILNSRFPMFIWWSRELYMFHNDAYLPALGNKHPAALGAHARQMWAEIWKDLGIVVDEILQGGSPFYAEALLLLLERKGFLEETYWTFSYSPAFDDQGQVNGIFCACSEVTATVLGERRLKSLKDVSEKMTEVQTLEEVSQLTCDLLLQNREDIPFCLIYLLNGATTTATLLAQAGTGPGTAPPAAIDLTDSRCGGLLARVLAAHQPVLLDLADLTREGNLSQTRGNKAGQAALLPIMRPGLNQVIGFFIAGISPKLAYNADYSGFHALLAGQIATSITSVQAREALARQQVYLQEIFQQAPVGITILSGPQHTIDLANPGVCQIWGRKPEDVIGKPVIEALPEIAGQGIIQLLDQVILTEKPFIANELPILLEHDGQLKTVYLNFIYHPLRDVQGAVSGVIAVAIDISEQVKYRHSVEGLNEELLATNADLDNFIYAASHDLKGPIINIESLMKALVEDLPPETLQTAPIKQVIDMIQSSINRFKRAIADLTEVARTQRQAGDDVAIVNLAQAVQEVQLDFDSVIVQSGARIDLNLAPDVCIQFSAKNIRSIIYNLLSNALKYRSPLRQPHIIFTTKTTPDHVVLTVQDNGLGLDQNQEAKIFSMFKRLHDHVEGSGIGLYIVKRIVENAGGTIRVESEIGVGTTFRIYFRPRLPK
jgi:PAS domain S-box-containing protein